MIKAMLLKKILVNPSGTHPCRLGCPEIKLSHPNEKNNNPNLIHLLINYNYLITLLINIWQLIDTQMKMSCMVSRAFILFTDAKDKRFTCNFFVIMLSKVHKETQNLHVFWVEMVGICRKIKSFCPNASDTLVHILLQLGTFHGHYANHKN